MMTRIMREGRMLHNLTCALRSKDLGCLAKLSGNTRNGKNSMFWERLTLADSFLALTPQKL